MAKKSTIAQYNATISAIRKSTGVSVKEARQAYRGAQVRMGRAPTAKDVKSRAVQQEAKSAGAKLAARERAEAKEREQRIARSRLSGKERKALQERGKAKGTLGPSKGKEERRGPAERGGGGPGGGPGGAAGPVHREMYEDIEYEEYDPIEYDTEGEY